jgi:hypothetical protein
MRKQLKAAAIQITLFPAPTRNQQLPHEVHMKTVNLLARLLRQHVLRNACPTREAEHGHE